jgi:hypothetical protein
MRSTEPCNAAQVNSFLPKHKGTSRNPVLSAELIKGSGLPVAVPTKCSCRRANAETGPRAIHVVAVDWPAGISAACYTLFRWCSRRGSHAAVQREAGGRVHKDEPNLRCPRNGKQTRSLNCSGDSAFITQPLDDNRVVWEGDGGRSVSPDTGQQGGGASGNRCAAVTLKHRRGRR